MQQAVTRQRFSCVQNSCLAAFDELYKLRRPGSNATEVNQEVESDAFASEQQLDWAGYRGNNIPGLNSVAVVLLDSTITESAAAFSRLQRAA